eukprot:7558087-Ditylum_brightwellii.AAC.1
MSMTESWKLRHALSTAGKEESDNIIYKLLSLELPTEKSEDDIPIDEGIETVEATPNRGSKDHPHIQDKNNEAKKP